MLKKWICIGVLLAVGLAWIVPIPFHGAFMGLVGLAGGFAIGKLV